MNGGGVSLPEITRSTSPSLPDDFAVLRIGSGGDEVRRLQGMINSLAERYLNVAVLPVDGEYNSAMATAVGELQKLGGLPPTGETDRETWSLIAGVYGAILV